MWEHALAILIVDMKVNAANVDVNLQLTTTTTTSTTWICLREGNGYLVSFK